MVLPPSPTHLIHMLILPPWKSLGWRPHVHFSFTGAMPHLWSHTELECPTAFLRDHYMSMRSVVDNLLCNTGWSMRTETFVLLRRGSNSSSLWCFSLLAALPYTFFKCCISHLQVCFLFLGAFHWDARMFILPCRRGNLVLPEIPTWLLQPRILCECR